MRAKDFLREFAPNPDSSGGGGDGKPGRNYWKKFIDLLEPEVRKLDFVRSEAPEYNTKKLTIFFKVKNQLQFTTLQIRIYDKDPSQIFWRVVYHSAGEESQLLANGLAPMTSEGVAAILVRLEDILEKHQDLNESTFTDHERQIRHFIEWCKKKLNITKPLPKIEFQDKKEGPDQHHTGYYNDNENVMWIYTGNRNLIDILRTVCHELVHRKQHENQPAEPGESYPFAPIEQEADAVAGGLIKLYAREFPKSIE